MAETGAPPGADEAEWRQRAVARSLNAARSRAEQRIQRFLDAAFALIDEKGTTEFTIQEVIDRSKQSMRGFYQYFDGKDELLLALFEETVREATDDLRRRGRVAGRIRWSACTPSRSGCTSGATRRRSRASAARTTGGRSRVLGAARGHHPDRVQAAMAPISRMMIELARRGRRRRARSRSTDTRHAAVAHAADGDVQLVRQPPGRQREKRVTAEETWEFCLDGLSG